MKHGILIAIFAMAFACKPTQETHEFESAKQLKLSAESDQNFLIHVSHLNTVFVVRKESESGLNLARRTHRPRTVEQHVDRQIQSEIKGKESARRAQASDKRTVGKRAVATEGDIVYRGMKINNFDAAGMMATGIAQPVMYRYVNNQVDDNSYIADTVQLHQQDSSNSIFISTSRNANAAIDYTAGQGHAGVIFKIRVAKDQGIDVDRVASNDKNVSAHREGDVLLLNVEPQDIIGFYDMDKAPIVNGQKDHLNASAFVANDTQIFDMFSRLQKEPVAEDLPRAEEIVLVVDHADGDADGEVRVIETFDRNGNLIEAEF